MSQFHSPLIVKFQTILNLCLMYHLLDLTFLKTKNWNPPLINARRGDLCHQQRGLKRGLSLLSSKGMWEGGGLPLHHSYPTEREGQWLPHFSVDEACWRGGRGLHPLCIVHGERRGQPPIVLSM